MIASVNTTIPRQLDLTKPLRVVKYGSFPGGYVNFARYSADKTIAIMVFLDPPDDGEESFERWATATVCLHPPGNPNPGEFGVWLKGWSENEGLPQALVESGILRLTGIGVATGFCMAEHAELTDIARQRLAIEIEAAPARFGLKERP